MRALIVSVEAFLNLLVPVRHRLLKTRDCMRLLVRASRRITEAVREGQDLREKLWRSLDGTQETCTSTSSRHLLTRDHFHHMDELLQKPNPLE